MHAEPPPQSGASRQWLRAPAQAPGEHGFSMIEITLAIGIVAFSFVSIFSLLPVGMNTFRKAVDNSLTTQIMQRIFNETKQTDFATLLTRPVVTRYFNDQGSEVAESSRWVYQLEARASAPTAFPGASTPPSANLATVTLRLAVNPGHKSDPFAVGSAISSVSQIAYVARASQ